MPILHTCHAVEHSSSFTCWPICPFLGFWERWEITCLKCQRTAVQNLTSLALSSAEKTISVQTNTHTQSTIHPDLVYRHVWIINTPVAAAAATRNSSLNITCRHGSLDPPKSTLQSATIFTWFTNVNDRQTHRQTTLLHP